MTCRKLFVLVGLQIMTALVWLNPAVASQLRLNWSDNSTNENGFEIERRTSTTSFTRIATVPSNVNTYTDSSLGNGTMYCYRVRAYNGNGSSSYTSEVCATTPFATATLTVSRVGNGTVTSSPTGINCSSDCSEVYATGTIVTLTATPAAGSTFSGWSGGGCSGTGSCILNVTANTSITATFTTTTTPVTLTVNRVGNGTVTSSPAGINCSSDCSEAYTTGTAVTLTATPASGSTFAGWSGGGCSGTGSCVVNLNTATTVNATFSTNSSCSAGQFLAEYFNNTSLSGSPVFTTCVSTINHNWGTGGPGNGIGNDQFSARWTGSFNFNASDYVFSATADDGVRVWVDGSQIINAWRDQAPTTYRATVNLSAGSHTIKVEYYEKGGGAVAQVSWQGSVTTPSTPTVSSITPNPINLAAPPSSFTVAGSGFSNQGFGLPIVNFTRSGTLLGQARASAMSGSTSVTVPFPTNATSLVGPLPGLSAGAVTVEVYNQTGAGTYSLPGSTLLSVTSPAVTLSTTPSSVTAGASVTATWSGIVSPTAGDWIGLYVPGTTDSALITGAWVYVSCSQVQGSGGVASGSCSFPIPASLTAGTYELRLFANRSVVRLANSGTFSVQAVPPATLSATPSSVMAGANVTATWSGIVSPTAGDWIGLYVPGTSDSALVAGAWSYVSCSRIQGSGGVASGSCSFPIPASLTAGTYELRLFANRSVVRLANSGTFSVQAVPPATLSATPSSVAAGANVTATWSGIVSPMPGDWIGLYVPGALDEALIAATWVYVSCSQTRGISGIAAGSCSFRIPSSLAAGTYELRLFANNSLQRLGKSNQFTVN